tara:strand:+ start:5035 stop:6255 length:1221 start_codon:yes stop_codon:yes gene_type:complete
MKFNYLVWFAALVLASCAAFVSVFGLGQLFAGAGTVVLVMVSGLEFAKLVAATALHRYWDRLSLLLRGYLTIGVLVLISLTSIGIYGFLSNGYQKTANSLNIEDSEIGVYEEKKATFDSRKGTNKELINYKSNRVISLTENANQLSKGLSNNVIQYKDDEGNIITTTSSSTRKTLERQLNGVNEDISELNSEIDGLINKNSALSDSSITYQRKILDITSNSQATAELGPLKYLSELTGWEMGRVVNLLIIIIMLVFDPMAVSLLIVANRISEIESGISTDEPKPKKQWFTKLKGKFKKKEGVIQTPIKESDSFTIEPEPVVIPEPVVEPEPVVIPEPIVVTDEKNNTDKLINVGKKILSKLIENGEPVKKQPIVTKGKITQEDVPQIKEGMARGFSVKVPEPKRKL